MRSAARPISLVVCFLLASTAAFAQETAIAGVVRDSSGAVLPGVTVEASSPALIEKSRTAVTDGSGQYRIIALVPGIYTVTFSLEGFNRSVREGIELRAETILPVNAELRVGALAESVTVTGTSPVVDLQTVSSVTVMTREILDVAPISRNLQTVGILIPGTSLQGSAQAVTRDVGGSSQGDQYPLTYRGSTASVTSVDGMRVSVVVASGQYGLFQNDGGRPGDQLQHRRRFGGDGTGWPSHQCRATGRRQYLQGHRQQQLHGRRWLERLQPGRRPQRTRDHVGEPDPPCVRLQPGVRWTHQARSLLVPHHGTLVGRHQDGHRHLLRRRSAVPGCTRPIRVTKGTTTAGRPASSIA